MRFIIEDKNLSKSRFSSPYGFRIHPITGRADGHRAIDIAMPTGTPLIAPLDGEVYLSAVNNGGHTKGYGYYIILKLVNGDYVLYAHLRELPKLKKGNKFKEGEVVAISGNTGSSTGAHVHFEYHKQGFLFRSQIKGKDTAIDPVIVYPELKGMNGKFLGDLKFENKAPVPKPILFTNFTNEDIRIQNKKIVTLRGVRENFNNGSYLQYIALRDVTSIGYDIKIENGETYLSKSDSYKSPITDMDYIITSLKKVDIAIIYDNKNIIVQGLENRDRNNSPTRFIPVSIFNQLGKTVSWNTVTKTVELK